MNREMESAHTRHDQYKEICRQVISIEPVESASHIYTGLCPLCKQGSTTYRGMEGITHDYDCAYILAKQILDNPLSAFAAQIIVFDKP